jgi:hypothetical protein
MKKGKEDADPAQAIAAEKNESASGQRPVKDDDETIA